MSAKKLFYLLNGCSCPEGYTENSLGQCEKVETTAATVTHSNYCVVASKLDAYSSFKSRIYNEGFSNSSIDLFTAPSIDVYAEMITETQWKSTSSENGPMNRSAVWIDSDCNTEKDPLTAGQQVTLAFTYNNTGEERIVYVGTGGDNLFTLTVNEDVIADSPQILYDGFYSDVHFKIWHLFPVHIIQGTNYFNIIATGDGTINDAIAMVVYDNTAAELYSATSDEDLTILYTSETVRGQHIDVATCDSGYNLDTSGGVGNYICTRTLIVDCE